MPDLPFGFDRADGLEGRLGTPSAEGQVQVVSSGGAGMENLPIEESPESPTIERAEQATLTHEYRMSWYEALTRIAGLPRGLVRVDNYGNIFKLLSATIRHEKPGKAVLTTTEEGKSFDSPPDQFGAAPEELGLNIIKHPRYFYAFLGGGYGSTTEKQNQMVIRLLQDYMENTNWALRDAITRLLKASIGSQAGNPAAAQPPLPKATTDSYGRPTYTWPVSSSQASGALVAGTDLAKRAALEIIMKYWRGEEQPYIVGWNIEWSQFYFYPQPLNPGGYIEDPLTQATPQLPDYFWSTTFPPDGNPNHNIFAQMAAMNPQCYSADGTPTGAVNISWLREADSYDYERTWFKLTRRWKGSPYGHWDVDLYNRNNRPSALSDYREVQVDAVS